MCEKLKKKNKKSVFELGAFISSQVASSVFRRVIERIKVKQSLRAYHSRHKHSSKIYSCKKVPVFPQTR